MPRVFLRNDGHWLQGLHGLHGLHGLRGLRRLQGLCGELHNARLRVLPKQLGLHRDRIARLRLPPLHFGGVDAERIHAEIVRKGRRWLDLSDECEEITCSAPGKNRQGASLQRYELEGSETNRSLRGNPDGRRTRRADAAE